MIPICHPSREVGLVFPTVIHLDAGVRGTRWSVSLQPHCFSVPSFPVPAIFYLLSWAPLHATPPPTPAPFPWAHLSSFPSLGLTPPVRLGFNDLADAPGAHTVLGRQLHLVPRATLEAVQLEGPLT